MGQHRRSIEAVDALRERLGPGPWPLAQVLDAGWTKDAVRRAVQAGRLTRLQRGVLAQPSGSPLDELRAALLTAPPEATISHRSAAVPQRLWVPPTRSGLTHLTIPGDPDDTRHGVRVHGCGLPMWRRTVLEGLPVTTAERSAVDTARGLHLPDALMVLDSFARLGLPDDEFLAREPEMRSRAREWAMPLLRGAYSEEFGWPGTVVVRDALVLVDPASESPYESRSRGFMTLHGLPAPELGVEVVGASGKHYWVDFLWLDHGVIGEADGLGKYGTDAASVRRALAAERLRQADLEAAGFVVIRWSPVEPPAAWLARLGRVLGRV